MRFFLLFIALASTALAASYEPTWSTIPPKRVIQHSDTNGAALMKAVEALKPGDKLELAAGTYSVERMWDIGVSGTAEAPIWIVAAEGAQVVITRPDDKQNVLNVGQGGPVKFLCLRGIEFTGGSHGVRLGRHRSGSPRRSLRPASPSPPRRRSALRRSSTRSA